jgi:PAS domain S-box-containing protein
MFGYSSKEEIIGLDPNDLSPNYQEDGTPSSMGVIKKLKEASTKGLIDFSWIHQRKDSSTFHADIQLQSIRIGEEALFQARMRDVTEIVMARRELEKKEAKLTNILSSLHGSFIGLLNRNLEFVDFWGTKELDEKYGIKGSDMRGRLLIDFIEEDLRQVISDNLYRTFEDGTPYGIELKLEFPTGRYWQDWSFSPFKTERDKIEHIVQFGRDTQDKNEIVEALVEVEKKGKEELRKTDRILSAINSVSSIMLRDGNYKDQVQEALSNIGNAVDASRVYIFRNSDDQEDGLIASRIFGWTKNGADPVIGNPDLLNIHMENGFQRWVDILSRGEVVEGDIDKFPEVESEQLKTHKILSIAIVPILIHGKFWGFIGFDDCQRKRTWFREEIKALTLAGSMLGAFITNLGFG